MSKNYPKTMTLKDITEKQAFEIASLVFPHPDWVTVPYEYTYQPHIPEWYEDAREICKINFEGYFAGDKTAKYRIEITTSLDVYMYYQFGEDNSYKLLATSNQNTIQKLFMKWGFEPYSI
jgi:hypothetical protein